jgi:hypothetical protein
MRKDFLPGVPVDRVLARLAKAGGNEIGSGKLANADSSAALAINTFGWFIDQPAALPPLPGMKPGIATSCVEVEYCARFPWRGGRHPWLDAIIETERQLIGVESKRFEPYRDRKLTTFSSAYDRPVWGKDMGAYEAMRDRLKSKKLTFAFLDAAQLVKHAFGLVTDAGRKRKSPALVYLFAEPASLNGHPIPKSSLSQHRKEIAQFATAVKGAEVAFHSISYLEWLKTWPGPPAAAGKHAKEVIERFRP